jgi:predicted nucleic acid-binding protein
VKAIADTGFLLAFLDKNDPYNFWAKSVLQQVEAPLLTCEAVLAETSFHLQSVSLALQTMSLGLVEIAFNCNEHLTELAALAERYSDRKPDLADLCLIRMSELHPKHVIVTVDEKDFRVYRRNKREIIPLICPSSWSM